jgi:hypothetical protein
MRQWLAVRPRRVCSEAARHVERAQMLLAYRQQRSFATRRVCSNKLVARRST